MSTLKFLRTSHAILRSTLWILVQGTFVMMGISSVVLMFSSKEAEGYALGALTLSACTCLYVSMVYDKISNLIERQNEREYHD